MSTPNDNTTPVPVFDLERDSFGRLVLTDAEGERHVGVTPVPPPTRALLEQELAVRDFAPTLLKLHGVSSFGVPSTWTVSTDRGDTSFVLKAEEDIRRLEGGALLIASAHGVQFRIPDVKVLDRASRKLLERFL